MRHVIKSPMIGRLLTWRSPSEPFVKVGERVEPMTTVCVIEALNVCDLIPAELNGRFIEYLRTGNNDFVDFAEPLFVVDSDDLP
ncbi:MAG: hypothetical protein K8T91_26040 [Planctomycetes bacterium]|nr:hypothetical protein [Planctomycetota bacterium]